mmetsp:Transcript_2634/g.8344  ORF Transcript_2634/g.8344 Transcript_2634/m.8344 type:complete len:219 (-) Transcript_2634:94-750(-)|eukprot:scaffold1374_cov115-Isochrysis_galbana.AAC.3
MRSHVAQGARVQSFGGTLHGRPRTASLVIDDVDHAAAFRPHAPIDPVNAPNHAELGHQALGGGQNRRRPGLPRQRLAHRQRLGVFRGQIVVQKLKALQPPLPLFLARVEEAGDELLAPALSPHVAQGVVQTCATFCCGHRKYPLQRVVHHNALLEDFAGRLGQLPQVAEQKALCALPECGDGRRGQPLGHQQLFLPLDGGVFGDASKFLHTELHLWAS